MLKRLRRAKRKKKKKTMQVKESSKDKAINGKLNHRKPRPFRGEGRKERDFDRDFFGKADRGPKLTKA